MDPANLSSFTNYRLALFLFICVVSLMLLGCMRSKTEILNNRIFQAEKDRELLNANAPIIDAPLTFEDIVQAILTRNLDLLVKYRQFEYQYEFATGAKFQMLPSLLWTGEISWRNRNTGISSESLEPGVPPAPPSISSDQHVNRYTFSLTWNLLDFGISYFRARQEVNKILMQVADYSRLQQTLIYEATKEYWRARAALYGLKQSRDLFKEANYYLTVLNEQIQQKRIPKEVGLLYQSSILKGKIQIQSFEREYDEAKAELAKMMGYPGLDFELADEEILPYNGRLPEARELENIALLNRPELFGLDADERSHADDIRIAILRLFPTLAPFIDFSYDSNSFLIFNKWITMGLRYSWELLSEPYHFQNILAEIRNKSVSQANRLALSIGILAQVNLARAVYFDTLKEYELARQLAETRQELIQTLERKQQVGELSAGEILINYKFDAILSEIDYLQAYGNLHTAIEQINNSIGIPFYLNTCSQSCVD